MSHVFSLDALSHHKVCLEFSKEKEPPSVHWQLHHAPVDATPSIHSLSIRVNESFVNGRPSITFFLVQDFMDHSTFPDNGQPQIFDNAISEYGIPVHPGLKESMDQSMSYVEPLQNSASETLTPLDMAADCSIYGTHTTEKENLLSVPDLMSIAANLAMYSSPLSDNAFDFESPQHVDPAETYPAFWSISSAVSPMDQLRLNPGETNFSYIETHFPSNATYPTIPLSPWSGSTSTAIQIPEHEWPESICQTVSPSTLSQPSPAEYNSDNGWPSHNSFPVAGNIPAPLTPRNPTGEDQPGSKTSQGSRRVRCAHDGCSRTFSNAYTCGVHARVHGPNKKKRFRCSLCEETFSRRHDMMRHEASQHGKVQEWTCQVCRRFFSSEAMLADHKCPALRKPPNELQKRT